MVDEHVYRAGVVGRVGISFRRNGGIEVVAKYFREIDIREDPYRRVETR